MASNDDDDDAFKGSKIVLRTPGDEKADLTYSNGDKFEGIVRDGQCVFGMLEKDNGVKYLGEFSGHDPAGEGTIMWPHRYTFEGRHNNLSPESGQLCFPNGDRHEGSWINNVPGPDGLRKYLDGRRNFSIINSSRKHLRSNRYKIWFTINNNHRMIENWNGDQWPLRENFECLPPDALNLEKSLILASSMGDESVVITVLTQYPNLASHAIDTLENKFAPALVVAAENGQAEIVRLLLLRGGDAECTNTDIDNAFHVAVRRGHVKVLEILLQKTKHLGLDVNNSFPHPSETMNKDGLVPFQIALREYEAAVDPYLVRAYDACIRLLIKWGVNPGAEDPIPLLLDVKSAFFTIVEVVVDPTGDVLAQRYIRTFRSWPKNLTIEQRRAESMKKFSDL